MRTCNVSDSTLQHNQGKNKIKAETLKCCGPRFQHPNMSHHSYTLCTHPPNRRGRANSRIMKIIQARWDGGNERMNQSKEGKRIIKKIPKTFK